MANFQTVKNALKKLESRQSETDQQDGCGVIFIDVFLKLPPLPEHHNGRRRKVGYLVVPRRSLTAAEWELECAQ